MKTVFKNVMYHIREHNKLSFMGFVILHFLILHFPLCACSKSGFHTVDLSPIRILPLLLHLSSQILLLKCAGYYFCTNGALCVNLCKQKAKIPVTMRKIMQYESMDLTQLAILLQLLTSLQMRLHSNSNTATIQQCKSSEQ